jgi:chromosomal replication initiator protein
MHNLWRKVWSTAGTGLPGTPDDTTDTAAGVLQEKRGSTVVLEDRSEPQTAQLQAAWPDLVEDLPPNQRVWVNASRPVALHGNTAIVAVGNEFTRSRIEGRFRTLMEDSLSARLGTPIRLAVTVDPAVPVHAEGAPATDAPESAPSAAGPGDGGGASDGSRDGSPHDRTAASSGAPPRPRHVFDDMSTDTFPDKSTNRSGDSSPLGHRSPNGVTEARLNPKYVFETFVIGSSNRFAHAAAVAAAEAPGKAYNPLLIYGESGLGKTHLLHAIGHYVRSLFSGARVRYVSSEEFTNEFINAIRDDKASSFHRRYRDVDVLLIDDIQFLEGKIQTQEEFFHTFNTLHNASKQIVISSDRPPKRLEALEDRLRNRFEWGLITDVQPPDLETRIAILRKKAALERLTAPPEVLEFIASKIQTNIRELEGALIRVTAFASLNGQPVDLTLTEIVLKDLIPEGTEPEITAGLIIAQTASHFGLAIEDVCGPSRSRNLVTARQIAMYLCRELTDLSLPKIGQQFGNRDHTTVMYANNRIRSELAERRSTYNTVTELTNRIKQQARQA